MLSCTETLTRELKKSNDQLVVHGKLIIQLSTNVATPIRAGSAAPARPSSTLASSNNASSSSLPVAPAVVETPVSPAPPTTDAPPNISTPSAVAAAVPGASASTGSTATSGAAAANRDFNAREDQHGPLPTGWERRVDHLGRTYYVDHSSRSTTWTRPQRETPAATEAANSWANQRSRTTADEFLGADSSAPPAINGAAAATTSSVIAPTTATPPPTTPSATPAAGTVGATSSTTQGSGPLPAGWEQRFTPEGRPYFVDHKWVSTLPLRVGRTADVDSIALELPLGSIRDGSNCFG